MRVNDAAISGRGNVGLAHASHSKLSNARANWRSTTRNGDFIGCALPGTASQAHEPAAHAPRRVGVVLTPPDQAEIRLIPRYRFAAGGLGFRGLQRILVADPDLSR